LGLLPPERSLPLLQVYAAVLVLGQRHDAAQVRFSQPLELLLQADVATAHIFASGLQLLR
jgi:hypothetical protein